jgi:accessory colonization factor AcfC
MILALFLACASEHEDAEVSGVGEGGTDIPVQTEEKTVTETEKSVSTKVEVTVVPSKETVTEKTTDAKSEETQTTDKTE